MNNRRHEFDDYERDVNEMRDNDEKYQNSEICPECGAKMKKYIESYPYHNTFLKQVVWECENPNCGN